MSKHLCSSLSEKSICFSLTAPILLDTLALPCDTLIINKTNGGQYPGDKMERKEINEMVQMTSAHRAGDKYIVNGMVEFADVAGITQGVWQWDGRYSPTIMPAERLTDKQRDLILDTAIEQVNEAAS